jgi:uncharacterized protein (TIGR00730 family)
MSSFEGDTRSTGCSRVLVYCASSESADSKFRRVASILGTALARASRTVVYGGGAQGSMGALASAALAAGGEVVGIQPKFMAELEWAHAGLSEMHLVETMAERKSLMLETSEAVVTLPGGSGTLEELFETISAKRLGLFVGPIIILNQDHYFDPCLKQLDACVGERFMDMRHKEMWTVVEEVEQVIAAIDGATPWSEEAIEFAAI